MAQYHHKNSVYEELCYLAPLFESTTGKDILKVFLKYLESAGIPLNKVFAVTTDGAPVMVGKHRGFVKLLENKIGHDVLEVHCIIHQKNL